MHMVIVSVQRGEEDEDRILEVPADLPASMLAAVIARACHWDVERGLYWTYDLWANPPGRILQPDEPLGKAGAWDGAHLVLKNPNPVAEDPLTPMISQQENNASIEPTWKKLKVKKPVQR
jgi:hypothetical protein